MIDLWWPLSVLSRSLVIDLMFGQALSKGVSHDCQKFGVARGSSSTWSWFKSRSGHQGVWGVSCMFCSRGSSMTSASPAYVNVRFLFQSNLRAPSSEIGEPCYHCNDISWPINNEQGISHKICPKVYAQVQATVQAFAMKNEKNLVV